MPLVCPWCAPDGAGSHHPFGGAQGGPLCERSPCLATGLLVVPLGWMWWASLVPAEYSVMDMGYVDLGDSRAEVRLDLTARKETFTLPSGRAFEGFSLNGSSPGPTLRARQGDLVEVRLRKRQRRRGHHPALARDRRTQPDGRRRGRHPGRGRGPGAERPPEDTLDLLSYGRPAAVGPAGGAPDHTFD